MAEATGPSRLSVGRLILIPGLITLAVTILRLVGERQHWSDVWFNRTMGVSIIGITWLAPVFGADVRLAVDTDRIEALSPDRAALWERVTKAPFLTINEKRAATGYGAVPGGDIFSP